MTSKCFILESLIIIIIHTIITKSNKNLFTKMITQMENLVNSFHNHVASAMSNQNLQSKSCSFCMEVSSACKKNIGFLVNRLDLVRLYLVSNNVLSLGI